MESAHFSRTWKSESDFVIRWRGKEAEFKLDACIQLAQSVIVTAEDMPQDFKDSLLAKFKVPVSGLTLTPLQTPMGLTHGWGSDTFSVLENLREHSSGCLRYSQPHNCFPDAFNLGPTSKWIWQPKEMDKDDSSDASRTK